MPLDAVGATGSPTSGIATRDVLSDHAYEAVRASYRSEILRLKQRRRIRLGSTALLCFESYETVLYHVHEVLRAEGRAPGRIERELAQYAPLVPGRNRLTATLLIDGNDPPTCRALGQRVCRPGGLVLAVDGHRAPSSPVGALDPDDPVQYLAFAVASGLTAALGEPTAFVRIQAGDEIIRVRSELRIELATDLTARPRVTRLSTLTTSDC